MSFILSMVFLVYGIYEQIMGPGEMCIRDREGDVYTLSGWAKLDAIPDTRVSLAAAVLYDSGDPKWVELDYNYYVDGWQYVSGIINTDDQNAPTSRKYLRIDVYVFYDNNYNKAYFDGFQMCKDDAPTLSLIHIFPSLIISLYPSPFTVIRETGLEGFASIFSRSRLIWAIREFSYP